MRFVIWFVRRPAFVCLAFGIQTLGIEFCMLSNAMFGENGLTKKTDVAGWMLFIFLDSEQGFRSQIALRVIWRHPHDSNGSKSVAQSKALFLWPGFDLKLPCGPHDSSHAVRLAWIPIETEMQEIPPKYRLNVPAFPGTSTETHHAISRIVRSTLSHHKKYVHLRLTYNARELFQWFNSLLC